MKLQPCVSVFSLRARMGIPGPIQIAWFGDFTGLVPESVPLAYLITVHDLPFAPDDLPFPETLLVFKTRALY